MAVPGSRPAGKPALTRALVAGIGCVLAATAGGQGDPCAELAETERQTCRLIRACAVIDQAERRLECFRAVAAGEQTEGDSVSLSVEARADRFVSPGDEAAPGPTEAHASETVPPPAPAPQVAAKARAYEVLTIPRRFTATVTAIHNPGRNRRLVALDGRLLFESDRAGEGRLRLRDEVRVVKTSALFGENYRITGPSRQPFPARRIRCEQPELNRANRRRCTLLSGN